MKRLFLFLLTICISQIVCQAYNGILNVRVGDSFSVDGGSYRYIQAVLWDFDPAVFETVSVSGYSTSGTFKAKAVSPTAGSIIQATIYYYKDGVPNSGVLKDVASWKVYVKDDGSNENYTVSLPATMNIDLNETKTITATPSSSNYRGSFYWRSNDSNIVEVISSNGSYATLRANSVGSTYIYVTLDNGNSDRVYVTVKDKLEYYILSSTDKTAGVRANPEGCSGTVTIPSTVKIGGVTYTVTEIDTGAFMNLSNITSVTIPNTVISIRSMAFYECTGLKSIKIGGQVSLIELETFNDCNGLTKAEFASIESLCNINFVGIDANPLYYAHNLYIGGKRMTDVVIPNSITSIGRYAFCNCSDLTSVTIPNSVTSIGIMAFSGCTGLSEISIPNSVTSIGSRAFSGCTGIKEFTIPCSVTEIRSNPFTSCTSLKEIKVDSNNNYFTAKDGALYSKDFKTLIGFPGGQSYVNIPNSVTSIGDYAFYGCIYPTSVTIPVSVTSIGGWAFNGCRSLTSVTISGSVTSIGNSAFYYCRDLTSVYYAATDPIFADSSCFFYSYQTATLYVPEVAVEKCKAIVPWRTFSKIEAYEFLGIEDISADFNSEQLYEVYNFNGVKVGDNTEALAPGIYIVRQGVTTKKIVVR